MHGCLCATAHVAWLLANSVQCALLLSTLCSFVVSGLHIKCFNREAISLVHRSNFGDSDML